MIELKRTELHSLLLAIAPAMAQYTWLIRAAVQLVPDLITEKVAQPPTLSLVIALHPLAAVFAQICSRELIAHIGGPQLLCIGQLIAGLGSLLMSVKFPTLWTILVGRGMQSVGVSLVSISIQRVGFLLGKPKQIQKVLAVISISRSVFALLAHLITGFVMEMSSQAWAYEIISLGVLGLITSAILPCMIPMRFVPRGFNEQSWGWQALSVVAFCALFGSGLICLFEGVYVYGGVLSCLGLVEISTVIVLRRKQLKKKELQTMEIPLTDSGAGVQPQTAAQPKLPLTARYLMCALATSEAVKGMDFYAVPLILRLIFKAPKWLAGVLLAVEPLVEIVGSPLISTVSKRHTARRSTLTFSILNLAVLLCSLTVVLTMQKFSTPLMYVWIVLLMVEKLSLLGHLVTLQSGHFAALVGSFTPKRTALNQTSREIGIFYGAIIAGGVLGTMGFTWLAFSVLIGIKIALGAATALFGALRVRHGHFSAQ